MTPPPIRPPQQSKTGGVKNFQKGHLFSCIRKLLVYYGGVMKTHTIKARAKRITKQAVVARILSHYQGDILNLDTIDRAWSSLRDEDPTPSRVRGWRILGGPSDQWLEDVSDLLAAELGNVDRVLDRVPHQPLGVEELK